MSKKKKESLNPIIEEKNTKVADNDLKEIALALAQSEEEGTRNEEGESFYKETIKQLYSRKNIDMKTEYLSVAENYVGAKLSFLAKELKMPYLKEFIDIFEAKRVSLERKGRKELLMGLQERVKDSEAQKMNNLKNLFGI